MNFKHLIRSAYTLLCPLFIAVFLLNACDSNELQSTRSNKYLDISDQNTVTTTISQYFSIYSYGETLQIYHFTKSNCVLLLRFPNSSADFVFDATLNLFADDVKESAINDWISNRYSDALIADAPSPIDVIELTADQKTVVGSQLVSSESGADGYIYNNYNVQYQIGSVDIENLVHLSAFVDEVLVHVRVPNNVVSTPIVLDANDITTLVTSTDVGGEPYKYSDSVRYYQFPAYTVVLRVILPFSGPALSVRAELVIFDNKESDSTIANWIHNQTTNQPVSAPEPLRVLGYMPISIASSQFLGSDAGVYGDEYENYQVNFVFDNYVLSSQASLKGFADSIVVHLITKDVDQVRNLNIADSTSHPVNPSFLWGAGNQSLYLFEEQKAILEMTYSIIAPDNVTLHGRLLFFPINATVEDINIWVANIGNDYYIPGGADPIMQYELPADLFSVASVEFLQVSVRPWGTYNTYKVEFNITDTAIKGVYSLAGFSYTVVMSEPI